MRQPVGVRIKFARTRDHIGRLGLGVRIAALFAAE